MVSPDDTAVNGQTNVVYFKAPSLEVLCDSLKDIMGEDAHPPCQMDVHIVGRIVKEPAVLGEGDEGIVKEAVLSDDYHANVRVHDVKHIGFFDSNPYRVESPQVPKNLIF